MTGNASAELASEFAGSEIEFIVEDVNIFRRNLVKAGGFSNGTAGLVHIRLWFEKENLLGSEAAFRHLSSKPLAPG